MGGICQTPPTELHFDPTKYKPSSLSRSRMRQRQIQIVPEIKQSKSPQKSNKPDPSFAVPVSITQLPKLSQPIRQRLTELGDYQYGNLTQSQQGEYLGNYKLQSGVFYDGQWKNGKIHGKGKYYLLGGSFYETITNLSKSSGCGRIIFQNGDYYQGDIQNNVANGNGVFLHNNSKYTGQFRNNLQDGYGEEIAIDYVFRGEYERGIRVKGILTYGDKMDTVYQGNFMDNIPHGFGRLTNQIGTYEGQFTNGIKNGPGKFSWKDGHTFVGTYKNDLKNGIGVLYDPQGNQVRKGNWTNDHFTNNVNPKH